MPPLPPAPLSRAVGGSQPCRTQAGEAVWEPARGRAHFLYSSFAVAALLAFPGLLI